MLSLELARIARITVAAILFARTASPAGPADDEKGVCFVAVDQAQHLRIEHKLVAARDQFRQCARPVCPALFRNDCAGWLAEVEVALPSVVLGARDSHGQDLVDVRVLADGRPFVDKLEGTPNDIDPGPHVFRFEWEGHGAVNQQVVIREGEKHRIITVPFPSGPPALGTPRGSPTVPAGVWVLGGLGVAGAVGFTGLFLSTASDVNALRGSSCAPRCPSSDLDGPRTKLALAYTSLGVGILSAGAATTWFVLSRSRHGESGALSLEPTIRGGMARWVIRY